MEYVKLKDICEFINGDRGKNYPKSSEYVKNGIPFVNAGHIDKLKVDFSKMNYISEEVFDKLGSGKIQNRDILFCLRGSLGKSALVDFGKGAIASSLVILRNKNEKRLNTSYLMYVLNSSLITTQIWKTNTGSSQPNLSAKSVQNYMIPLPSLEEQHYIVNILDKAQSLIDKRKAQITALSDLTQSVFLEMFGDPINSKWEKRRLLVIADVRDGTHDSPKYIEEGFPLITSKNIKNGRIDFENVNYISSEDYIKINQRSKVDVGDILMPMIGTIGNPVVVQDEPSFAIKNVALIKFNNPSLNNIYLKELLNSHFLEFVTQKNSRGGTQKFLSLTDIRNMEIPLPPIDLQRKFSSRIEVIERQKDLFQKGLIQFEYNFNSLLQLGLKGELSNKNLINF